MNFWARLGEVSRDNCIFTDGACSGNPGPGGWGAVVLRQGQVRELGGGHPKTTNNRMEMQAALEALEFWFSQTPVAAREKITVHTDSKYLIGGLTQWLPNWKKRNWRTSAGKPVLNIDLWQKLDQLNYPFIKWQHCPAHQGIAGNERCDEIAVQFSKGRRPRLFQGPLSAYKVLA